MLEDEGVGHARSSTSCATGSSAASGTGASRSRSCWMRRATRTRCPMNRAAGDAAGDGGLQADRHARAAAEQGEGLAARRRRRRARSPARPTPCRSGPGRAGITCGTSTRRTTSDSSIRRRKSTGCRSTCTSAASSTRCCTCSTRGSGTRCCSTSGTSRTPEPFARLVNQGLILGETEYHVFADADGQPVSAAEVRDIDEEATERGRTIIGVHKQTGAEAHRPAARPRSEVEKAGDGYRAEVRPDDPRRRPQLQDEQEPRQRRQPRRDRRRLRGRHLPALRDVHGPAGSAEAVEHARHRRHVPVPQRRLAQPGRRRRRLDRRPSSASTDAPDPRGDSTGRCTARSRRSARTSTPCASTPPSPS